MTYTDNYDYSAAKIMDDDFITLKNAPTSKKPALFLEYCQKIIDAKNNGVLPLRDAAYAIAAAMSIKELDDPSLVLP